MGVPVIKSLKPKHDETIMNWIENGKVIDVDYPDNTREILEQVVRLGAKSPESRIKIQETV